MRDDEPDGYTSWHIWAPKNLKGRAKACQTPGCVIAVHVGDKPSRFIPKALP